METRSKAVETWSDFSRSHLPAGALWSSTGTPFPVTSRFALLSTRFAPPFAFRAAHETVPSRRGIAVFMNMNIAIYSKLTTKLTKFHPPRASKREEVRKDRRTKHTIFAVTFYWFFFFFFYNDPKNRFWCISLNDRLRVFWQITNFLYFCWKSRYFGKLLFSKIIIFNNPPPPDQLFRNLNSAAWQNEVQNGRFRSPVRINFCKIERFQNFLKMKT